MFLPVQPNLSSTYAETDWLNTTIAIGDLVGELLVLRLVGATWSRRLLEYCSDDGGADGVRPDGLFRPPKNQPPRSFR